MPKRTRIVLPSSDHLLIIHEDVREPDLELTFLIGVKLGDETYFDLDIQSEKEVLEIAANLEKFMTLERPIDRDDFDSETLESPWPFSDKDDSDEYVSLNEYSIYWVDAEHICHDVTIEHIGEVHAEESEDDSEYADIGG